jgi:hypothetical protein
MNTHQHIRLIFRGWLYLLALHSAVIGLSLIFMPVDLLPAFGFTPTSDKFFPFQGGLFHLLMAVAYVMAGTEPARYSGVVRLAICVKLAAFGCLILYYVLLAPVLVVLLSGLVDGMMGVIIWYLYRQLARTGSEPLSAQEVRGG